MVRLRGISTRDVILIVFALAVVVVAVLLFMRGGAEDSAPTDQFAEFYCPECDYTFRLSHAQIDQIWKENEFVTHGDRGMLFKCTKCGKMTAERSVARGATPPPGDQP